MACNISDTITRDYLLRRSLFTPTSRKSLNRPSSSEFHGAGGYTIEYITLS